MLKDEIKYEADYIPKTLVDSSEQIAHDLLECYEQLNNFSHDLFYKIAQEYATEKEIKLCPITHPLRIMITMEAVGASIFETMAVLSKEKIYQTHARLFEK